MNVSMKQAVEPPILGLIKYDVGQGVI